MSNLEWVTNKENMQHAYLNGLVTIGQKLRQITSERCSKKVIDKSTGLCYDSVVLAAKANNIKTDTLGQYLRGSRKNKTTLEYLI